MAQLSNIVDWCENAKASGNRICGLMDVPVRIEDRPDAIALDDVERRLEYDDVTFAYDDGETVAIVGPTGAGKSTVAKLLLRLCDVTDGAVRVDGHDVRDVRLADLRSSIGYVSQDTFLFDGTVAEKIRYGRLDVGREDVVAVETAEAHNFIQGLSAGYDTRVGERGLKLSGGQRQRIAIARTVLQDPEILLLDEATSAVDTETEYLIQRSLDRLAADRTTLVIVYRLSTVKDADPIVVLDEGEVVERGSQEELLAADGLYANLWGVQAGEIGSLPEEFYSRTRESQPPDSGTRRETTSPRSTRRDWLAGHSAGRGLRLLGREIAVSQNVSISRLTSSSSSDSAVIFHLKTLVPPPPPIIVTAQVVSSVNSITIVAVTPVPSIR
jgi:ATP-binding cassette subfamily B protein